VSRRWFLDFAAAQQATVFTAHFPQTSAGRVLRKHYEFEWHYL